MSSLSVNDVVLIHSDNLTFNGMLAVVKEPTEWGAIVVVHGWVPGKPPEKREYRVLFEEADFIGKLPPSEPPPAPKADDAIRPVSRGYSRESPRATIRTATRGVPTPSTNGHHPSVDKARLSGYTGDVCEACGGVRMLRVGSCLRCEDCNTTGGCG